MKKLMIFIFCSLFSTAVFSQEKTDFSSFSKNNISFAIRTPLFMSVKSNLTYKRMLKNQTDMIKYFRMSAYATGYLGNKNIPKYDQKDIYKRIDGNISVGLEFLRKKKHFVLSYGYELGFIYSNFKSGLRSINPSFIFVSPIEGSSIGYKDKFYIITPIAFIGAKYFINDTFSFGIEGAIGMGVWLATSKDDGLKKGLMFSSLPLRYFTVEYNF